MDRYELGLKLLSRQVGEVLGKEVSELTHDEVEASILFFGSRSPSVTAVIDILERLDETDDRKIRDLASLRRIVKLADKMSANSERSEGK